MSDLAAAAFWLSLAAAVLVGFGADIGPLRWCAIGWLGLVGGLFSLCNWAYLVIQARNGARGLSFIPLVGGVLIVAALAAVPVAHWRLWAPIGLLVDPSPAIYLIGSVAHWTRSRRDDKSQRD